MTSYVQNNEQKTMFLVYVVFCFMSFYSNFISQVISQFKKVTVLPGMYGCAILENFYCKIYWKLSKTFKMTIFWEISGPKVIEISEILKTAWHNCNRGCIYDRLKLPFPNKKYRVRIRVPRRNNAYLQTAHAQNGQSIVHRYLVAILYMHLT